MGWTAGLAKADIAAQLGRHRCTIGRELARNRTRSYPTQACVMPASCVIASIDAP